MGVRVGRVQKLKGSSHDERAFTDHAFIGRIQETKKKVFGYVWTAQVYTSVQSTQGLRRPITEFVEPQTYLLACVPNTDSNQAAHSRMRMRRLI